MNATNKEDVQHDHPDDGDVHHDRPDDVVCEDHPGDDGEDHPGDAGKQHDHPVPPLPGPGRKRRRCAECYRAAGKLTPKKVLTICQRCSKPFCPAHLHLYCGNCDVDRLPQAPDQHQAQAEALAHNEREREQLQTIERQRLQIE